MTSSTFAAKEAALKNLFASCDTQEKIYAKIIELGRRLPPFPEEEKIPANLVRGCQSQMYLTSSYKEGKVYFKVYSDALISAGLAALLLFVYDEEPPEIILTHPPAFLKDLNLIHSLSPGRSNGLAALLSKMKLLAIKHKI